jgi:O-antigen/teichoic acid export membrane protein
MSTLETPKVVPLRQRFPWVSDAARQQIKEYAPTFLAEGAGVVSQIIAYKLAAHYLGKQGFSEYAVARRAISTIYPVGLLGMGVALPRFIAISAREDEACLRDRFFGATLWCVGLSVLIIVGLLNLMPLKFSYLIYGSGSYRSLAFPISTIIAGLSLHALAYGYFRGQLQMTRANALQLVNFGVVPLVVLLWGTRSAEGVLEEIGLLSIVVSVVGLLFTPWYKFTSNCAAEAKILLRYGIPRVPGDFALMALLGLPSFVIAHRSGVIEGGYVAFAISILVMIGAGFAPVGLVLLPRASNLIARGAREELARHISLIFRFSLFISAFLTISLEVSAGPLLRSYLGRDFAEVVKVFRIVVLGAVPYAAYSALRCVIDAKYARAVNTLNSLIALGVLVACSALLFAIHDTSVIRLILPLPISLLVLGILTWREARKIALG